MFKYHCKRLLHGLKNLGREGKNGKFLGVIIGLLTRMFKTPMKMHFASQIILFKKLSNAKIQFPFVMDDNKFYICF